MKRAARRFRTICFHTNTNAALYGAAIFMRLRIRLIASKKNEKFFYGSATRIRLIVYNKRTRSILRFGSSSL